MLAEMQMREGAPAVAVHLGGVVSQPREVALDSFRCLLCVADDAVREALAAAAEQAGWHVVQAENPDQAWSALSQAAFHLTVVDLQQRTPASIGEARELCEQLAVHAKRLLMVCGHEADPLQEVWARQLGTWLYVPGLSSDVSSDDLQGICCEARAVVERWHPELVAGGI